MKHSVDVDLVKKGRNLWYDRGKVKVTELLSLTRMAGGDEPLSCLPPAWATRMLHKLERVAKIALCPTASCA